MLKLELEGIRHPLTLVGIAVTTTAAILICTLFTFEVLGFLGNPYIGILTFMILPAIFVAGLVMIPMGVLLWHRRVRKAAEKGQAPPPFPIIDFNRIHTRKIALLVLLLTVVNVVILSSATYKGVETMDSTEFCGSCHSVMEPEFTAYQGSPHARVGCVECHIGPGASWFVKSKLSGAWQVVSVAFDLYPRPIPTPIHNLRPARDTCEQCHWPEKFVGDRLKVIPQYEDDEQNTELKTVLLLRVGGIQGRKSEGIHWHVDPGVKIRYRSDPSRETIHDVELTLPDGTVKLYESPDAQEGNGDAEPTEWRLMDCVDCHNRPTHVYGAPEVKVAQAISEGRIDRSLPYIAREGVEVLREEFASHDEAREGIARWIRGFYTENYPETAAERSEAIEQAVGAISQIYTTSVFPGMK
ncbi:MAG: NapC/NirT family cytochrome c, partial [Acidobacteriota bacterium]|nr:NapC/NirT family cytochrome c [Acidobacteriota bacterium]